MAANASVVAEFTLCSQSLPSSGNRMLGIFSRRSFENIQDHDLHVTLENADELVAGMPALRTVPEKMNGLLMLLVKSKFPPGTPVAFDPQKDYPLIFAANWQEANFLLGQLSLRSFVSALTGTAKWQLNASAYERAEQLEAASYKS